VVLLVWTMIPLRCRERGNAEAAADSPSHLMNHPTQPVTVACGGRLTGRNASRKTVAASPSRSRAASGCAAVEGLCHRPSPRTSDAVQTSASEQLGLAQDVSLFVAADSPPLWQWSSSHAAVESVAQASPELCWHRLGWQQVDLTLPAPSEKSTYPGHHCQPDSENRPKTIDGEQAPGPFRPN
jgi:hypothetical protein